MGKEGSGVGGGDDSAEEGFGLIGDMPKGRLFRNKYRIDTIRLKFWDYRWPAHYFVTFCTKNRQQYFGQVREGKMFFSDVGYLAQKYWLEIPSHFLNVGLDEFVIMPDHIHGILVIKGDCGDVALQPRSAVALQPRSAVALQRLNNGNNYFSQISPKAGSLSAVIRSFKSICSRSVNEIHGRGFLIWHPLFYEHIIRDELALGRIRKYIRDNPKNWHKNN